jgi:hypothetical protein
MGAILLFDRSKDSSGKSHPKLTRADVAIYLLSRPQTFPAA